MEQDRREDKGLKLSIGRKAGGEDKGDQVFQCARQTREKRTVLNA